MTHNSLKKVLKSTEFLLSLHAKGQTIEEWAHNCSFDSYAEDLRCHLREMVGDGGDQYLDPGRKLDDEEIESIVRLALISLRSNLQDR
jgi:hypothetical protein